MPRPGNLPAVAPTRHGNQNSASLNWRAGTAGRHELWVRLNNGQKITSSAERAANPDNFWGWPNPAVIPTGVVWERVYFQVPPAAAAPQVERSQGKTR
jgi:hypothetical protein